MKLKKEICKLCINERHRQYGKFNQFEIQSHEWTSTDEIRWNEQSDIWCRETLVDDYNINRIPKRCRYKLEQMVIENETQQENM